ncbi:hypothetical protein P280DRAFT_528264 [Massarina eburnea CBS 473.64]|uniref:Uncharacterized protein n=1 Tax=Massarina eburnea CBS 473.64 TaxID=1395130 RepID=A0A6A6RTK3_9PLEO|nr:hypothetical protein P280DRAFT_528264 [Massarina eburnea CBS 473.64]
MAPNKRHLTLPCKSPESTASRLDKLKKRLPILETFPTAHAFRFVRTSKTPYLYLGIRKLHAAQPGHHCYARVDTNADGLPTVTFWGKEVSGDDGTVHSRAATNILRAAWRLEKPFCFLHFDIANETYRAGDMLRAMVLYYFAVAGVSDAAFQSPKFDASMELATVYIGCRSEYREWISRMEREVTLDAVEEMPVQDAEKKAVTYVEEAAHVSEESIAQYLEEIVQNVEKELEKEGENVHEDADHTRTIISSGATTIQSQGSSVTSMQGVPALDALSARYSPLYNPIVRGPTRCVKEASAVAQNEDSNESLGEATTIAKRASDDSLMGQQPGSINLAEVPNGSLRTRRKILLAEYTNLRTSNKVDRNADLGVKVVPTTMTDVAVENEAFASAQPDFVVDTSEPMDVDDSIDKQQDVADDEARSQYSENTNMELDSVLDEPPSNNAPNAEPMVHDHAGSEGSVGMETSTDSEEEGNDIESDSQKDSATVPSDSMNLTDAMPETPVPQPGRTPFNFGSRFGRTPFWGGPNNSSQQAWYRSMPSDTRVPYPVVPTRRSYSNIAAHFDKK